MYLENFQTIPVSSGSDLQINRIDIFGPFGLVSRFVDVKVHLSLERRDLAYAGDVSHFATIHGSSDIPSVLAEYHQEDDIISGDGHIICHICFRMFSLTIVIFMAKCQVLLSISRNLLSLVPLMVLRIWNVLVFGHRVTL
jgi:hypothetical protein